VKARLKNDQWELGVVLVLAFAACACTTARQPGGTSPTTSSDPVPVTEEPGAGLRTRETLARTLAEFGEILEAKSGRRLAEMLATDMEDLPRFEDAVSELFRQSGELRVFLRPASTEVKGNRATMIADAEMIYSRRDRPGTDQRRRDRIQFDFVLTREGWKIYQITPREFFLP